MKQEKKNSRVRLILVMIVLLAALLAAIFLTDPGGEKTESIQAVMKDAVLHEDNQMAFLGMQVNPSVISDWVVTGLLLVVAALLRISQFRTSSSFPASCKAHWKRWFRSSGIWRSRTARIATGSSACTYSARGCTSLLVRSLNCWAFRA